MSAIFPASQNKRRTLYRNAMYAAIGLLALCAIASRMFGITMHVPATLVLGVVAVLSVVQFNALDEVAKQAHYVAWYWGGLIGLAGMALLTIAIGVAPGAFSLIESAMMQSFGKADAQTNFLLGLIVTPTLMMLAFAGWWGVYWLRRR